MMSIILSFLLLASTFVAAFDSVVDLDYASYQGVTNEATDVTSFLGMRFARPPIRFRAPQLPANEKSKGVIKLTGPGKSCISLTSGAEIAPNEDEDCLFINVFAPKQGKGLPVLLQIQGGGLAGSNAAGVDGTSLINASGQKIIVVTFNYRVNFWGFLAGRQIRHAERKGRKSKDYANFNIGYLDQRAAMRWVQKHIHMFGGDASQVVLTGQSAGAGSIAAHLTAYGGRDDKLFIGAAMESQSFGYVSTLKEAQYQYDAMVDVAGCKDKRNDDPKKDETLRCLRSISPKDLQKRIHEKYGSKGPNDPSDVFKLPYPGVKSKREPVYMWGPVLDLSFVQDYPFAMLDANKFVKVPIVAGDGTNEGDVFVGEGDKLKSMGDVADFMKASYPKLNDDQLSTIKDLFPAKNNNFLSSAAQVYGLGRYVCPGNYLSSAFAKAQPNVPVWNYRFDVGFATHVAEGGLIWGTSKDKTKTKQMQDYWTSFILHRDPNKRLASGATIWDQWDAKKMNRLLIDDDKNSMETVSKVEQDRCSKLNEMRCRTGQRKDCA